MIRRIPFDTTRPDADLSWITADGEAIEGMQSADVDHQAETLLTGPSSTG